MGETSGHPLRPLRGRLPHKGGGRGRASSKAPFAKGAPGEAGWGPELRRWVGENPPLPPAAAPLPLRREAFGPLYSGEKRPKVGRLHTFNGNEGALRPFFFAWQHLGHQVYQMSTSKPANPLRRKGLAGFPFSRSSTRRLPVCTFLYRIR